MAEKNIFSLFFCFLRNPATPHRKGNSKKLKNFIFLFLFSMVVDFFLDLLCMNQWIINEFNVTNIDSHIEEIYSNGFWFSLLTIGMVAPIFEELLQRSYLTSFIWNNTLVPINIGLIFIFLFQIAGYFLISLSIIVLLISNLTYSKLLNNKRTKGRLLKFYSKNFKFYFYLSAMSFGTIHIANYKMEHFVPLLSIFLVLPQIFGGLMLGYIRVVMGLGWSICFHALHNLFFLILLFINHQAK